MRSWPTLLAWGKPLLAATIMGGAVWALRALTEAHLFLLCLAGAVIYAGAVAAMRVLDHQDRQVLNQLLAQVFGFRRGVRRIGLSNTNK
jgi:hypothetical protein